MNIIILSDFDGTITTQDTLARILDRFAETDWRHIERKVGSEEFGNKIGLRQEFGLCDPKKATKEAIVQLLNEEIEIDPYFKPFIEFCEREAYGFEIISGGFSLCIDTILKKYRLGNIQYYSNKLLFGKDKLDIEYPHSAQECEECGNCKTMHLGRYRAMGYYVIYIGDSTTDRCPARYADLVFAKDHLSEYCAAQKIPYIPYQTFADIQAHLLANELIEENICDACLPTDEQARQGEKT